MKKVVFVCVHNSGRSQMAEAFAKKLGDGRLEVFSAGTEPGSGLNPAAVAAMREIGIDMSSHYPKMITLEMVEGADKIITMGCGVDASSCPAAFLPTEDWGLEDPKDQPIEKVREIRDQIKEKVQSMLAELGI